MTTEIAIMNKTAVALAADSAVTVTLGPERKKIYKSVNKVFTLSKYQPIGIMIYGNSELLSVPWESIIKIYRQRLGTTRFPKVLDYGENFIAFLEQGNVFSKEIQEKYFLFITKEYLTGLRDLVLEKVKSEFESKGHLDENRIKTILTGVISEKLQDLEGISVLSCFEKHDCDFAEARQKEINSLIDGIFSHLPLSIDDREALFRVVNYRSIKDTFYGGISSGIVISGFGMDDIFPTLLDYQIETMIDDRLKYTLKKKACMGPDATASIIPFAQREDISNFIEGIHPRLREFLEKSFSDLLTNRLPKEIVEFLSLGNIRDEDRIRKDLTEICRGVQENISKEIASYSQGKHIDPIIGAVSVLPKDELAVMAETLVNLTSFKKRVSLDDETVGGPVDVAVISKGDGFVWIKRKHYFKPELNPHYLDRYFDV